MFMQTNRQRRAGVLAALLLALSGRPAARLATRN
jgi:hypothetical protein